ncbi:MAG: hypothetical protein SGI90_07535 [Candidatus Eisenbacteria bacterium]|nr:hypothetical protein [Candidatus Eisenbacteria bacterium]
MTPKGTDSVPPPSIDRREWFALAAVALLGLAIRVALWSTQSIPSVDGTAYLRMAQAFAGGPGIDSVHQYGYPALIWLAHFLIPDWVLAARVVALVAGTLLIPITGWLGAAFLRDRRLRLLPAAALAVTPLAIRYSLTTMTDMPFLALFFLGIGLSARTRWLAAGAVFGASYVIRPEGLLGVLIVALLQWRRPASWVRLLAGAALIVIPYVVAVGLTDGRWTLSPKSLNIAAGSWTAAEAQAGGEVVGMGVSERLARFGGETIRLYPQRAGEVLRQLGAQSGYLPLLLGPLGLFGPTWLLLAGLSQIILLPLTFIGARVRYLFPFLPILWILSLVTIERVRRPAGRLALTLLLVGSITFAAWFSRDLYTMNEDGYFPELVEAGTWLKALCTPATIVYDRKPYTAYYAGAIGRFTPAGGYDAILDEIVARGGDFLVVHDWVTERFRPELLPLARDAAVVAAESRLRPIYFEQSARGMRTLIYRIIRTGGPPPTIGEEEIRQAVLGVLSTP